MVTPHSAIQYLRSPQLLSILLTLLLVLLLQSIAPLSLLAKDIVWQDEMEIPVGYHIDAGDNLTVSKGARITLRSEVEVQGRFIAEQAMFIGGGLVLKNPSVGSRVTDCTFTAAKTALKILGGSPVIANSIFEKSDVGLELRQRSMATVRNSTFIDNRKVGFFVKDDATPMIIKNRFVNNGKYGLYLFRSNPLQLSDNIFEGNGTGLMASGSLVNGTIQHNRFFNNAIGLFVDRAANPAITANILMKNNIAIKLHRRSDPTISGNLLAENKKGLFISFSSYPTISGNDLESNEIATYLEYQSVVWERSQGESTRNSEIDRMSAFGRSDKRETLPGVTRELPKAGLINAQGNWWGESGTMELRRGIKNLTTVDDGHDRPTFLEDGRSYPLDIVDLRDYRTERINQHLPNGQLLEIKQ